MKGGAVLELREKDDNGLLLGEVCFPKSNNDKKYAWNRMMNAIIELPHQLPDEMDICVVIKPDEGADMVLDHFYFF